MALASLLGRVHRFLRSPRGQKLRRRGEEFARDPRTQHKVRTLRNRLRKR